MRAGRTQQVFTRRWTAEGARRVPDELVVEEPLAIHLDGTLVATTMRTPGHDFELAVGFCHAEGLLDGARVQTVRYCGTGSAAETEFNVVSIDTGGAAPAPRPRLGSVGSSCGLCGSVAIAELCDRLVPFAGDPFPFDVLAGAPEKVHDAQALFAVTGAVHAAAAVDRSGQVMLVREDIGRHNALDKVVGRLLLDHALPASELAVFVSGRASFEMVQKAWAAGFGAIVAVSAPSALAVETARTANLTLAGFARRGVMNLYSETTR